MTGPYLFTGSDPDEAMAEALAALGDEAMILSVTRKGALTEVVATAGPTAPRSGGFAETLAAARAARPVPTVEDAWRALARPRLVLAAVAGAPGLATALAIGPEFAARRGAPLRLVLSEAPLAEARAQGLDAVCDLLAMPAPGTVAPPGGRFAEIWVLTGPEAPGLADEVLSEGLSDCVVALPTGLRRTRALAAAEPWMHRACGLVLAAPPEAPVEEADRQAARATGLPLCLVAELSGGAAAAFPEDVPTSGTAVA